MYAGARVSRLTSEWGASDTSADVELHNSLRALRGRSRQLCRDASTAKRARTIVVNNVIGTGIGLQSAIQNLRGKPATAINDQVEALWRQWCRAENCHIAGVLNFAELERLAMAEIFEAGEVFIRPRFRALGPAGVPLSLELIEAERIADMVEAGALTAGGVSRLGVEVDKFGRPIAYNIRELHPGEVRSTLLQTDRVERVPAEVIYHLRIINRWPQTRGEPWLHTAVRKLNDIDGYTEAEIIAARGGAAIMGTIETEDPDDPLGEENEAGEAEFEIEPGLVKRLRPGDKFAMHAANRPNNQADPFLRFLLREIAAGVGVSYEALSRDYSQSNYSSSRLALLDDRDTWRVIQGWFIRAFREPLHRQWMQAAVLAGKLPAIKVDQYAADPERFSAARFKPRGWSWVDPTKEVAAFKEAVKAGFMTVSDVVAATADGRDLEEILAGRVAELEAMADAELVFDVSPEAYAKAPGAADQAPGGQAQEVSQDDQADQDDQDDQDGEPESQGAARAAGSLAYLRQAGGIRSR